MNNRTVGMPDVEPDQIDVRPCLVLPVLSLKQPCASLVAENKKRIETRIWATDYRGPLLIAASASPRVADLPTGKALSIENLIDCRPMRREDEGRARCEIYPRAQSWILGEHWPIVPFPVKGRQGFYNVAVARSAVGDDDLYDHLAVLSHDGYVAMKAHGKRWIIWS